MLVGKLAFDNIELGRLRSRAAEFVRYMIRARAKVEPEFLSAADYERWELDGLSSNEWDVERLLRMARQLIQEINEKWLERCGSGGLRVDAEDPLRELKELIGFFTNYQWALPNAISSAIAGKPIDWLGLAEWANLPAIRVELDKLPRLEDQLQSASDGPDRLRREIRWKGRSKTLGDKLFPLAAYLWHSQCVPKRELIANIWPEKDGDVQLSTYVTRLNTILLELKVPWAYHLQGDSVVKVSYTSGSRL